MPSETNIFYIDLLIEISCNQIERELILSSDKASSKIPLMHESRTPSGIRRAGGIPLLSRQPASIAPDHPPKQAHAWVSLNFNPSRYIKVFIDTNGWLIESNSHHSYSCAFFFHARAHFCMCDSKINSKDL